MGLKQFTERGLGIKRALSKAAVTINAGLLASHQGSNSDEVVTHRPVCAAAGSCQLVATCTSSKPNFSGTPIAAC